ncbi:hypothetical protein GCM10007978_49180 [Shewanella hanedai]|uniref:Uncharacterized protein n=1 Tax=Shewanella hanedai TaxID=25 RepID=A0A553JD02_SHEHA|nr:DUF6506 family protein [Shewanella hanedai]TRY10341.1 hypothetical protein FN961_25355 [Shewanella hanedai]GGJ05749.1 hypothetical protein GCM10007978_49180 [Shewanella hanedai]
MTLTHYGFIVLAKGYQPKIQRSVMENEHFKTQVIGVSSVEDAVTVANDLIKEGVQVIELCGGFGEDNANKVINSLDSQTPIGFVGFSVSETQKLSKLLKLTFKLND